MVAISLLSLLVLGRVSPLDLAGAAEYLGVTPRHVRRLRSDKKLAYVKVGGALRFLVSDLDAFLTANRVDPADSRRGTGAASGTRTRSSSSLTNTSAKSAGHG